MWDARLRGRPSAVGQQGLEAIPGLDRALAHAGREGALDDLGRAHVTDGGDLGASVDLLEDEGLRPALRSEPVDFEHEGPLETLWGVDLEVLPKEGHVVA